MALQPGLPLSQIVQNIVEDTVSLKEAEQLYFSPKPEDAGAAFAQLVEVFASEDDSLLKRIPIKGTRRCTWGV
jgi:hypothetical protein